MQALMLKLARLLVEVAELASGGQFSNAQAARYCHRQDKQE